VNRANHGTAGPQARVERPRNLRRLTLLAAALAAAGWIAGCAPPPPPAKDYTKGEYYTPEESARLPAAERDRYCNHLQTSLASRKAETEALRTRLDSLTIRADTLRAQAVLVSTQTREVNALLRDLRLKDKANNSYVVKSGDNLRKIAATLYGEPQRWKEIYNANKALIGAENAELKPGTRLTVPRAAAGGK